MRVMFQITKINKKNIYNNQQTGSAQGDLQKTTKLVVEATSVAKYICGLNFKFQVLCVWHG